MLILFIIVLCMENTFHYEFIKFGENLNFVIGFGSVLSFTILERGEYHFDKKYN